MVVYAGSTCNSYVFGRFLEEVGAGFGGLGHCVTCIAPEHLLLIAQRFLASDLLALAEDCIAALLNINPLAH